LAIAVETMSESCHPMFEADPAKRLRILVVEDNTDTAHAMSEVLELWDHEVRLAYDGPGAIDVALAYQPEVILLDIGLPGMDGYQVAQVLRQDRRFTTTLMVAITGYGQPDDIRKSQEAGINYHFTKPINLGALQDLLEGTVQLLHPPLVPPEE
jgi:CheY-like chemotaxis protein